MSAVNGSAAALELRAVHVPFGADASDAGLVDISLTIEAGERIAVVGPSGVGKTTLLRAIAGLSPLRAGTMLVDGIEVTGEPPERRRCAYLHQSPVLFPHLDVFENVAFPLRVRRTKGDAIQARVLELLDRLQLGGLERRSTDALSGGQRHRVALARALAAEPRVLLLDEPLSALDPALRDEVRTTLAALAGPGLPALLLVTHDLDDAALLADRVLVLLDGSIVQRATPAELFARPATLRVARFLGVPNQIPVVVVNDTVHSALGVFPIAAFGNHPLAPSGADHQIDATLVASADAVRLTTEAGGDGVAGRVVGIHVRSTQTTALVELADTPAHVVIECAVPRVASNPTGTLVRVLLDPSAALVYLAR